MSKAKPVHLWIKPELFMNGQFPIAENGFPLKREHILKLIKCKCFSPPSGKFPFQLRYSKWCFCLHHHFGYPNHIVHLIFNNLALVFLKKPEERRRLDERLALCRSEIDYETCYADEVLPVSEFILLLYLQNIHSMEQLSTTYLEEEWSTLLSSGHNTKVYDEIKHFKFVKSNLEEMVELFEKEALLKAGRISMESVAILGMIIEGFQDRRSLMTLKNLVLMEKDKLAHRKEREVVHWINTTGKKKAKKPKAQPTSSEEPEAVEGRASPQTKSAAKKILLPSTPEPIVLSHEEIQTNIYERIPPHEEVSEGEEELFIENLYSFILSLDNKIAKNTVSTSLKDGAKMRSAGQAVNLQKLYIKYKTEVDNLPSRIYELLLVMGKKANKWFKEKMPNNEAVLEGIPLNIGAKLGPDEVNVKRLTAMVAWANSLKEPKDRIIPSMGRGYSPGASTKMQKYQLLMAPGAHFLWPLLKEEGDEAEFGYFLSSMLILDWLRYYNSGNEVTLQKYMRDGLYATQAPGAIFAAMRNIGVEEFKTQIANPIVRGVLKQVLDVEQVKACGPAQRMAATNKHAASIFGSSRE